VRRFNRRDGRLKASSKVAESTAQPHRFGQSSPLGVYRWLVLL